jgi:hypothetical protein
VEDVVEIRRLRGEGQTMLSIAARFRVDESWAASLTS